MRPIIVILLAAAAALAPSAGAGASGVIRCSSLHGGFENHIREGGLNCTVAHKIVNMWHRKAVTNGQGPGNKTIGDFKCRSTKLDPEHVAVTCRHKEFTNQYVKFHAGP